jgi:predicted extracellular nuclease
MINKFKTFTLTLTLGVLLSTSTSQALILITEINSNGTGGDFFEIYNSGASSVDLTNWKWADYDIRTWSGGFTLNSSTILAGETAVIPVASGGGTSAAIAAFKASWGLSDSVKLIGYSGAGAGLGKSDGVVLFNSSGNVAASLIYNLLPGLATQSDSSTVQLATFIKATSPQPTAGEHAGVMGGGAANASLVWDPTSGTANPTYQSAVVGQWDAFANPGSSATIGSPGVAVPEPSSTALLGLGSLALLGLRRLNRKA